MQRGVALEALCNRSSSFGTEIVELETAGVGFGGGWCGVSMGADTKFGGWFELQAAYLSDCSVVLPLRPSARAAPPLGPRLFNKRLRAWERVRVLRVSMGIDRKANTRAAAHSKLVICVSLRVAESAEAPLSPIELRARLRATGRARMVREQACQRALTERRTLGA